MDQQKSGTPKWCGLILNSSKIQNLWVEGLEFYQISPHFTPHPTIYQTNAPETLPRDLLHELKHQLP